MLIHYIFKSGTLHDPANIPGHKCIGSTYTFHMVKGTAKEFAKCVSVMVYINSDNKLGLWMTPLCFPTEILAFHMTTRTMLRVHLKPMLLFSGQT